MVNEKPKRRQIRLMGLMPMYQMPDTSRQAREQNRKLE